MTASTRSLCQTWCIYLAVKGFRSEKGMRSSLGSLSRTSLAALSAASSPRKSTCPGTQLKQFPSGAHQLRTDSYTMHTNTHTHTHKHEGTRAHTHTYTHTRTRVCTHTHIHTHTHTCTHTHDVHTHTHLADTLTHRAHTYSQLPHLKTTHAYTHTPRVHTHTHTNKHTP